jgi:nitrous oxide reductase accessory protein NosL
MTGMARRLALTAVAASVAVTVVVAGCSTDQPSASTTPTTSASAQGGVCQVNPKTEPMPTAEKYRPVPANARISVTTSGIPSEAIKPGDPPAEIDVTLCNDSPVDYPKVGS